MSKEKSIGYKIATTAIWLVAIPALVIAAALRGQKEPNIKK